MYQALGFAFVAFRPSPWAGSLQYFVGPETESDDVQHKLRTTKYKRCRQIADPIKKVLINWGPPRYTKCSDKFWTSKYKKIWCCSVRKKEIRREKHGNGIRKKKKKDERLQGCGSEIFRWWVWSRREARKICYPVLYLMNFKGMQQ